MSGTPVFDTLHKRERYLDAFQSYQATVKNGEKLPVHQYVEPDVYGLSIETPPKFRVEVPEPEQLPEIVAAYLVEALKHEGELHESLDNEVNDDALVILLWFRAMDLVEERHSTPFNPPFYQTVKREDPFRKQCEYYASQDFGMRLKLAQHVRGRILGRYGDCFQQASYDRHKLFVSEWGRERLLREWPDLAAEVGISSDALTDE